MFSLKAPKNAAAAPATSTSRSDLHPVAHIADCLLDYQKQLSTSEVHSLDELQSITQAFQLVLDENAALREKLDSFHELFGDVDRASVNLLPSNLTLPALSVLHSSVLTDWCDSPALQCVFGNTEHSPISGFRSEDQGLHGTDHLNCQPDKHACPECFDWEAARAGE